MTVSAGIYQHSWRKAPQRTMKKPVAPASCRLPSRRFHRNCQNYCPFYGNCTRHPGLDPGSRSWIPAFAGMTRKGTLFFATAVKVSVKKCETALLNEGKPSHPDAISQFDHNCSRAAGFTNLSTERPTDFPCKRMSSPRCQQKESAASFPSEPMWVRIHLLLSQSLSYV